MTRGWADGCARDAVGLVVVVFSTWSGSGCGASGADRTRRYAEDKVLQTARPPLVVLRVRSDVYPVSGFPIGQNLAVTAAYGMEDGHDIVAVDGVPTHVFRKQQYHDRISTKSRSARDDWVILHSLDPLFDPNIIDTEVALREGDRVLVGGYPLREVQPSDVDFWSMPPRVIEGRIRHGWFTLPGNEHVVPIELPWGEYRGFSGGPVAIVDSTGNVRVWGLVVRSWWRWRPPLEFTKVIGAVRLPAAAVAEARQARYCNATEDPAAICWREPWQGKRKPSASQPATAP